jgi:membrane associated rhomboid family serine protease
METVAFGKKKKPRPAPPAPPPPQAAAPDEPPKLYESELEPPLRSVTFAAAPVISIPYLTFGLIAVLVLIFRAEDIQLFSLQDLLELNLPAVVAKGGISGQAVLTNGEWWRIATAPLLHASVFDLLSNAFALLVAGWIFERLIGRAWFAALFAISALGSSIGCLVLNAPEDVSYGASGAVLGLLAAAFVCSFIFESEQLRRRMQKGTFRLLWPSLLPVAWSWFDGSFQQSDFGAILGGAVAGACTGYLLGEIWRENDAHPPGRAFACVFAGAYGIAAAAAFVMIAIK